MVGTSRRSRKSAGTLFVPLPGNQESRLQELVEELPADHLARQIVQAVNRLDLSEFLASYHGQGSLPYRPDVLLRVVLNGRVNAKPQIRSLSAFPKTVELVNADFKEHRRLRRFSGRGLQRAEAEVGLLVLVNNLLVCLRYAVPPQPAKENRAKLGKCREIKPDDL